MSLGATFSLWQSGKSIPNDLMPSENDGFIAKVQTIVDDDPSKSIRAITRDLQVHCKTVWRCIHEDLRYSSYVMRRGQFMAQQTKENRYKNAKSCCVKSSIPRDPKCFGSFPTRKNSTKIKRKG